MKENDIDCRKTAESGQSFQRGWLALFHEQLDDSGPQSPTAGQCCPPVLQSGPPQAVTSDPTFSPSITRRMLPGWFMLKMIIGRLLSLHRLTAVRSITFSPCFRISM